MSSPWSRSFSWLPLAGLLAGATLALGWLLLDFASVRNGMRPLAGASEATVEWLHADFDRARNDPAEIAARPAADWRAWTTAGFAPGENSKVAWLRVTLRNASDAPVAGVLADAVRYADRVDLFEAFERGDGTKDWRRLRSGEWTPMRERALWGRETAFPVLVPARGERTFYLRYEDRLAVWLELQWWSDAGAFHAAVLRGFIAEACYFGLLLALLFYNAGVWLRLRFPSTGWYLLYSGTFIVYLFGVRSGVVALGGALGSPWMELIGSVTMPLSGAFLAEFARRFLELGQRAPRADRVMRIARHALSVLAVLAVAAPLIGQARGLGLIVLASSVVHLALLGVMIAVWRADGWQARYAVLGLGSLIAGLLPATIWLKDAPLETLSRAAMVGSALEMLLLSLAIAGRLGGLQQEKLAAQERATAEAEQRRVLQEAYADELEHEVRERTRELLAANADKDRMMAVLGHDLRSPLTSLTLAAEQAANAGGAPEARTDFAADAAQTGRALLLLLEDVVLWARLRAGSGKAAEHAAAAVVAPATELHRAAAVRRGVALDVTTEPGLGVRTDLVLAQTLVRNLTSNAVKLARSRVVVTVACDGAPERVRVGVRDDGPGLPPEVAARLRTWPPEQDGANHPWAARSGLGLRLCVEIAQAMGTRLEAAEAAGGGAEISFTLPRSKA